MNEIDLILPFLMILLVGSRYSVSLGDILWNTTFCILVFPALQTHITLFLIHSLTYFSLSLSLLLSPQHIYSSPVCWCVWWIRMFDFRIERERRYRRKPVRMMRGRFSSLTERVPSEEMSSPYLISPHNTIQHNTHHTFISGFSIALIIFSSPQVSFWYHYVWYRIFGREVEVILERYPRSLGKEPYGIPSSSFDPVSSNTVLNSCSIWDEKKTILMSNRIRITRQPKQYIIASD
jgi:hypothetical protein